MINHLSAVLLSHHRGAVQVWRRKRRPYQLGPHGEPNRVRLRSVGLSQYMIRIDDEQER
jgi:hypothetical protein